jgi:hypothetical protein
MADLGDTLVWRSDLYDKPSEDGGVLVNATTVVLTITFPDLTTTTPTVTNPPATTGKYFYRQVVSPTGQTGSYTGTWLFTLATGETTSYVDSFEVGVSLVTIREATTHLRAGGTIVTANDLEQLQWLCAVSTDAVERDLGRTIIRKTVTETFDGGQSAILLTNTPVISVTTIVESGVTLAATDYTVNLKAGIVYRGGQQSPRSWLWGRQNIVATTLAGYAIRPVVVRKVALNGVQRMWQSSQQAAHPFLDDVSAEEAVFAAAGTLTPLEFAAYNSLRAPGFA